MICEFLSHGFNFCQVDLGTMPNDHSNTHLQQRDTHHPVTQDLKLRVPLSFEIMPGFSSMEHKMQLFFTDNINIKPHILYVYRHISRLAAITLCQ